MAFFKKNNIPSSNTLDNVENISASSTEKPSQAVNLNKATVSLEKKIVSLAKTTGVNLNAHKARVFVVLDRSGSMWSLYHSGAVQDVLTRLLPLALKFDDNGELEVYIFNNNCNEMTSMNLQNYQDYVENFILKKGYEPTGGTSYSPAIRKTVNNYNDGSSLPAFGIFITDGENSDRIGTNSAIRDSSYCKIFYQFVGIGNERFNYLQKLDDLDGREVDNTAFVKVSDFAKLSDDELYDKLLEQYPQWLRAMNIN